MMKTRVAINAAVSSCQRIVRNIMWIGERERERESIGGGEGR